MPNKLYRTSWRRSIEKWEIKMIVLQQARRHLKSNKLVRVGPTFMMAFKITIDIIIISIVS